MASTGGVEQGSNPMARLFSKPKKVYENMQNESVFVSPLLSDMIYIRSCEGCEFFVQDKAAKCIVEKCSNVTVRFDSFLLSGTLELIGCKGVKVSTKVQLPTISVDGCEDLELTFREPRAVGAVYTVRSKGVSVRVLSPEQKFELKLPTPEQDGVGFQYVSTISGDTAVTELCIREGAGYLTTQKKLQEALAREKELEKQIEKYLRGVISISKPGDKSAGDKSAGDKSAGDKSAGDKSAEDKSAGDKSAGDKSAGDKSAGDKSAGDKSAGDKSAEDKSAADKSAGDKGAGDKSAGDKGAEDKSAGDKSAEDKSAADKTDNNGSQSPSTTEADKPVDQVPKPAAPLDDGGNPSVGGNDSPMAAALRSMKGGLKPTVTVEKHLPIVGVPSGGGGGAGGGGKASGSGVFDPSIKDEEEKKEFFDSEKELARKVDIAAAWLKKSKHAITFTGAGISTSCGIPDFRSGMNTVLPTGPGIWELRAQAAFKPSRTVKLIKAIPSLTHMSLVKLHEEGVVKATVSQNVDGLHRRSGLRPSELAELHGNTNLETCAKCSKQYLRDFETREARHVFDHRTSRLCDDPECHGVLNDSIINFGENLPQNEVKKAFDHAEKADLCVVMGSSLRVSPACDIPVIVHKNRGKVIVCNLQKVPQFQESSNRCLLVFCKCDDFMSRLMKKLGHEVSPFSLKRRVKVSSILSKESCVIAVTGIDPYEDTPYSFVKHVVVHHDDAMFESGSEPHTVTLPPDTKDVHITLYFHGHYAEPPHTLDYTVSSTSKLFNLKYSVSEGLWETSTN